MNCGGGGGGLLVTLSPFNFFLTSIKSEFCDLNVFKNFRFT